MCLVRNRSVPCFRLQLQNRIAAYPLEQGWPLTALFPPAPVPRAGAKAWMSKKTFVPKALWLRAFFRD